MGEATVSLVGEPVKAAHGGVRTCFYGSEFSVLEGKAGSRPGPAVGGGRGGAGGSSFRDEDPTSGG